MHEVFASSYSQPSTELLDEDAPAVRYSKKDNDIDVWNVDSLIENVTNSEQRYSAGAEIGHNELALAS